MEKQSTTSKWKRRVLSIPLLFLFSTLLLSGAPIFLLLSLLTDLIRSRKWPTTRCFLYILLFVSCEVIGVLVATWGWIICRSREDLLAFTVRLQIWWTGVLYGGLLRIFSMKVDLEGDDCLKMGPMLVFPRHISAADTIIPSGLILRPHKIHLRYVMKAELLWDPCLDIACNRLPNLFIKRTSEKRDENLAGIRSIARDLSEKEGVLFYPEGTRFTPSKLNQVREKLSSGSPDHLVESMNRLEHVLPPKLGGTLTLVRAAPEVDVVFMATYGLDAVTTFANLINGGLVGHPLRIRCWRVPHSEIPREQEAQEKWLLEEWEKMDRIVGELKSADAAD
jgi:1-acyl-sn-glycerol-3-phosphate acyltransferase